MKINEVNKEIYEKAFISDGTYGDLCGWKPSINEDEIHESCEYSDGTWGPATPLGYRDYKVSRAEGLNNLFTQEPSISLTYDEAHEVTQDNVPFKQYDKITIEGTEYIVTGENYEKDRYYLVDDKDHRFYIEYSSRD